MSRSVNDKGVCRTAPATPGLLIKLQGNRGGSSTSRPDMEKVRSVGSTARVKL